MQRNPAIRRVWGPIVLVAALLIGGCAGGSVPRPPAALGVERYSVEIAAARGPEGQGGPFARLLGVRTARDGFYLDVLVDAGSQSAAVASAVARWLQGLEPSTWVGIVDSRGQPVELRQAVLRWGDYYPWRFPFAESPDPPLPPRYAVRRQGDREAVIQVLVVGAASAVVPGRYAAEFLPAAARDPESLVFIATDPVAFSRE